MRFRSIIRPLIFASALSITTAGCAIDAPAADTEAAISVSSKTKVTIEKELRAFNDQFNTIAANHDVDGFLSLYTPDALWIEGDKRPAKGHGEPRKTFQFLAENKGILTHTVDHLHIAEDGSQAVMIGEAIIKVDAAGLDATGTYLFVMKRDGDDWKIVTDMFHQHSRK